MFYVLFFIFGASIGSFVQVIATRLNVAPIIKGRSKCLSCGEALRAFDLFPVLSHIFLRGKCRYCKSSYGISSLLIEVIYGIIFIALYQFVLSGQLTVLASFIWLVYYSLLFISLGVMALYDYTHSYVPVSYLFFYCILTFGMMIHRFIGDPVSLDLLSPIFVSLPFLIIWLVTRGKGIGFGDVLLFLGVGAFFGVPQGLAVFMISVWMGAFVGALTYLLRRKHLIKNTAIPFVPFIVISFIIVLFTNIDIFSISQIFVK